MVAEARIEFSSPFGTCSILPVCRLEYVGRDPDHWGENGDPFGKTGTHGVARWLGCVVREGSTS